MRVVITIEDSPESQSVMVPPAATVTPIPQVGGTGTPGPLHVDSMPALPAAPPPELAARALAIGAISAGPAPERLSSAAEAPPAFMPGAPGSPGSSSLGTADDLPAGAAPPYANRPETDVDVVEADPDPGAKPGGAAPG